MTPRTALQLGLVAGGLAGLIVYSTRGPERVFTYAAPPSTPARTVSPPSALLSSAPSVPRATRLPEVDPSVDADYSGRTLVKVSFVGRDLRGADFTGAVLEGVDFRGARLGGARFDGCLCDAYCRWPAGFDPAGRGAMQLLFQTR